MAPLGAADPFVWLPAAPLALAFLLAILCVSSRSMAALYLSRAEPYAFDLKSSLPSALSVAASRGTGEGDREELAEFIEASDDEDDMMGEEGSSNQQDNTASDAKLDDDEVYEAATISRG